MAPNLGADIGRAARILEAGGVVAIPTETVYGLAANALNPNAVARIFTIKKRPSFDPLIVHIGHKERVHHYATTFPEPAQALATAFWPGSLTLIVEKKPVIPDIVSAGLSTVGLRMPRHPLTLRLLQSLDFPLAAPSANPFGYISPTTARHVYDQLGAQIDYILDGGPCQVGLESTIVGFPEGEPVVYRLGGIAVEQLEEVVGRVKVQLNVSSNPQAPGQLKTHYAPKKPLWLGNIEEMAKKIDVSEWALLSFQTDYTYLGAKMNIRLSSDGLLEEAATRLFAVLRSLDEAPVQGILAERLPDEGLGRAINDRLERAAARS